MALPTTIAGPTGAQNSYHGPFKSSGGSFYAVMLRTVSLNGQVGLYKATDPTDSWSLAATSAIAVGTEELSSLWCVQDGDTVHIGCQKNNAVSTNPHDVYYLSADISGDSLSIETLIEELGTNDDGPNAVACSIAVESTGSDIVVVYQGDPEMLMGVEYARIDANRSDDSGATWGGPISIDNGGSVQWTGCVIVPGSSDRMHVFFKSDTADDAYQRRINSDDSLETFPSSFDDAISGNLYAFGPGVSYDDGGTQRVRCPYQDSSAKVSIAKLDSADTPTVTEDVDASDNTALAVNEQLTASLAVDTKDIQLLYSNAADSDLYRDTNDDDAGWGTDTEELDAVTVNHISSNVYDRSGTKLAFIYDDGGTVKYNEIDLAAGNDQTLTATAIGVPAIRLHVSKALKATAVANPRLKRKFFETFEATAIGIATLKARSIFSVVLAATASGIAGLKKKARLRLSAAAGGVVTLTKKISLTLNTTATGDPNLIIKAKLILQATATGIASVVVNALAGATLLTLAATATAIASIKLTVKKRLAAVSLGVPSLTRKAFKRLLAAVGAGVATLSKKAKLTLPVPATGLPTISTRATFRRILSATATGVAGLTKKAKLRLRATGEGVATLTNVKLAVTITLAAAAIGIPALSKKVKLGLGATGAGVANIRLFVSKTLRTTAIGIAVVNELGPTIAEKLKTRVIGFFGGPGGGPGR